MIRVRLRKPLTFNWIRVSARVGKGLGGPPVGNAASEAAPDGEALVWVVVVKLGFQTIEDSVEGGGCRQPNEAKS